MKNISETRCKKCGKVIVGASKMGLCDSCFNKQATKGGGILLAIGAAWKPIIKPIGKAISNAIENALKNK